MNLLLNHTRYILVFLFISWSLNAQVALPTFHGVQATPKELYSFSSHTFTNCGATGRTGPTLANCKSSYDTVWEGDTDFFNVQTQGIQEWTAPANGTYRIEAYGSQGGGSSGGLGARMRGDFELAEGDVIKIVVGQQGGTAGNSNTTSSGGGSFVIKSPYSSNNSILVIAGGGGGSPGSSDYQSGGYDNGQTGTSGSRGYGSWLFSNGGTSGNGGSSSYRAAAGGGFLADGADNGQHASYGTGGDAFVNGAKGGEDLHVVAGVDGGFGGGGSGMVSGYRGSGGGGGYSGGGTGTQNSNGSNHQGGGGGSYNSGSNTSNSSGARSGHGQVIITRI